ncbi:MAG: NAD(P)/FAD-dependent oxidoreductase [archaeon]
MKSIDVAIIGAGPAGLSAGIYCANYGLKTVIIEKGITGGRANLAGTVRNYPGFMEISGAELVQTMKDQAKKAGAEIKRGNVLKLTDNGKEKEIGLEEEKISAKVVIVAVGTRNKFLGVPGEKEFLNKGVHYCATCDGPIYSEKNVAIIGCGNAALHEALYMEKIAKKITILCPTKKFGGNNDLAEIVKKKGIETIFSAQIIRFEGNKFLEKILLKTINGKEKILTIDGAFIYAGTEPSTEFVNVKKSASEKIIVNAKMETNVKGILAAGDCAETPLGQIATAVGEGAIAAHSASQLLQKN